MPSSLLLAHVGLRVFVGHFVIRIGFFDSELTSGLFSVVSRAAVTLC